MLRRLNRHSPIPLYYQLQEILKQDLESGRWKPGHLIPSESELAATFGISRTVIRKALDILEADGQVSRVKGKGTVVSEPKTWFEVGSTPNSLSEGSALNSARISAVLESTTTEAGAQVGRLLSTPQDSRVFFVACVQSVNGEPGALGQTFVRCDASERLCELAPAALDVRPDGDDVMAQLEDRYGLKVASSEVIVESTTSNAYESEVLGIRVGIPVFLLSSLSLGKSGEAIGFTRLIARADTFRLAVRVSHERRGLGADPKGGEAD